RVSETQRVYLLTFATEGRAAWFANGPLAEAAVAALLDRRSWSHSTLLAWVLMPDHWHGIVELGPDESLPALVRQLKCSSSRRVRATMGCDGALGDLGFGLSRPGVAQGRGGGGDGEVCGDESSAGR
ncbi:transposase, partial [Xanthomonas citri pv. citri]